MSPGMQTLNTLGILQFQRQKKIVKLLTFIYGLIEKFIWIEYLIDGCTINNGPSHLRGFHQIDIQTCSATDTS